MKDYRKAIAGYTFNPSQETFDRLMEAMEAHFGEKFDDVIEAICLMDAEFMDYLSEY